MNENQTKKSSENILAKEWKKVRIVLSAILVFALILIVALNFDSLFYLNNVSPESGDIWREISSLIVAGTIALWLQPPEDLISDMKNKKKERTKIFIFLVLFFVGILAVWFAVRAIGLFIFKIDIELSRSPIRQASSVLSLLGYVVAANLPFTLLRTYHGGDSENEEEQDQRISPAAYKQNLKIIKGAIDVLLQAILIILLTFIPLLGKETSLQGVGGIVGFSIIFLSILGTLAIFLIVRKNVSTEIRNYR